MAVVARDNDENDPTADGRKPEVAPESHDDREDAEERDEERPERPEGGRPAVAGLGGGFFHLYKPGQGYWTRLGTVLAVATIIALLAQFMFGRLALIKALTPGVITGIVTGFVVVVAVLLWRVLNKPTVVDFLIATESEMKKVNWTSRKDLIGSTKIVVVFMFLIATILFLYDVVFGYLFQLIRVLKHGPFA